MVGRNAALDGVRKRSARRPSCRTRTRISDLDDVETPLAERLDGAHYRDDILRLLFICCHPDLPATQQIALALRIVSGLSVKQIARAFLVGEAAMEQRITRAKARIAKAEVAVRGAGRRSSAPSGSRRWRPWSTWCSTRAIRPARDDGRGPRAAVRRGDPAGAACCCACSRPSRRSWA